MWWSYSHYTWRGTCMSHSDVHCCKPVNKPEDMAPQCMLTNVLNRLSLHLLVKHVQHEKSACTAWKISMYSMKLLIVNVIIWPYLYARVDIRCVQFLSLWLLCTKAFEKWFRDTCECAKHQHTVWSCANKLHEPRPGQFHRSCNSLVACKPQCVATCCGAQSTSHASYMTQLKQI